MKMKLSKADARLLALNAQFRFHRGTFTPDRQGALDVIKHLGYVQVDSIFVVERAHHHIIWSRQQDYTNSFIDKLQEKPRQIFEYWTHAAAYLPMEDFRFYLPRMRRVKKDGFEWFQRDKRVMRYVKDRVAAEGPLQAKDFKDIKRKAGAWWGWKPAKIALEHLFMEGTLMVVGRENFRKIYDLAERVLLPDTVTKIPTPLQSAEYLIQRAVRSMGIVSYKDIVYLRKDGVEKVKSLLERRVKSGVLQAVEIEGVNDTYYINKDDINRNVRESLVSGKEPVMRILSPFDNFVINRKRLKELFDFDYKLECFVPPGKRRFGYFSLPLLYKDGFIGIMDAKAERKEKRLIIKNLHLEQIPEKDFDMDTFSRLFSRELKAFMEFNGCSQLVVETGMLPDPLVGVFRCT